MAIREEPPPPGTMAAGERELILKASHGDEAAFAELVGRYVPVVLGVAYRLTRNAADAEEIAQDVFLSLYRKLDRYDPALPFRPWIVRIALNRTYSFLRRRGVRREVPIDQLQPRFDRMGMQMPEEPSYTPDLDGRLAQADAVEFLEMALGDLPEKFGIPVFLSDVAGVSIAAAAEVLKLSVPGFKSRLHRGRIALRRRMLERYGNSSGPSAREASGMGGRAMGVTCREVVEALLLDYLQEELTTEDRARFEEHIRACDRCGPFVESYRTTVSQLNRLGRPPIPREVVDATLEFLRESLESGKTLGKSWERGLARSMKHRLRRAFTRGG